MVKTEQVQYTNISAPHIASPDKPVLISDQTYAKHMNRLQSAMQKEGFDAVVIYADKEHGDNFYYFTGFEPRFEEAALIVRQNGKPHMMLGNEMYKMHQYSRVEVQPVACPYFSLPNQPMETEKTVAELFCQAGIAKGDRVGLIGWKMFTGRCENNALLFDMPHYWISAIQENIGAEGKMENAARLLIDPDSGIRTVLEADEIAEYEVNAAWASQCVETLLKDLAPGKTELELAQHLHAYGQFTPCHPMCATGARFGGAVVSPRYKKVEVGDAFTTSMSLRGGLTCRAAYVAKTEADLPEAARNYVDVMARPYFAAAATWYETVGLGVTGGEVYAAVDTVFPKSEYGWTLNPGHLCASEEWMSSPIEKDSKATLKSGMILQMDIIPSRPPYGGINAEEGIALADEALREELKRTYPEMWARVEQRRKYMMEELGIQLKPEVLPLSNLAAYVRPLLLDQERALKIVRD